jgi:hypothetical protein
LEKAIAQQPVPVPLLMIVTNDKNNKENSSIVDANVDNSYSNNENDKRE